MTEKSPHNQHNTSQETTKLSSTTIERWANALSSAEKLLSVQEDYPEDSLEITPDVVAAFNLALLELRPLAERILEERTELSFARFTGKAKMPNIEASGAVARQIFSRLVFVIWSVFTKGDIERLLRVRAKQLAGSSNEYKSIKNAILAMETFQKEVSEETKTQSLQKLVEAIAKASKVLGVSDDETAKIRQSGRGQVSG